MAGFFEDAFGGGEPEDAEFVPDPTGHDHILPDGVKTRVGLHLVHRHHRLEWCLPDRRLQVPETHFRSTSARQGRIRTAPLP